MGYRAEYVNGYGYQVFDDERELPLSALEVQHELNRKNRIERIQKERFEKVRLILNEEYPFINDYSKDGLLDIINKIMLVVMKDG